MKSTLIALAVLILSSFASTTNDFQSGDYDAVISKAVKKLIKKPNAKDAKAMDRAYRLANDRDLERVAYLEKVHNPDNYDELSAMYARLKDRQRIVRTVTPLTVDGQTYEYEYIDYDAKLAAALNSNKNVSKKADNQKEASAKNDSKTLLNTNNGGNSLENVTKDQWVKKSVTKFQMQNPQTNSYEVIMFTNPGKYIEIRDEKDFRVNDLDILEILVQASVAGLYTAGQITDGIRESTSAASTIRYRGNFVLIDNSGLPSKQDLTIIDFFYDRSNKLSGLTFSSNICKCRAQIFFTDYSEGMQILK